MNKTDIGNPFINLGSYPGRNRILYPSSTQKFPERQCYSLNLKYETSTIPRSLREVGSVIGLVSTKNLFYNKTDSPLLPDLCGLGSPS